MSLGCVLWDFGDTLADERWMLRAPPGVPEWPQAWSEVAGGELADRWYLGEISLADVEAVGDRLPMAGAAIAEHIRWCCSNLSFFELPLRIARESALPQAIVTVNPDGFSELVVPACRLDELFRPIVTSWEERTLDKGSLALLALERLGDAIQPADALLIDNKPECLRAWARHGGRGYLFRGEQQLRADLEGALRDLAESAGWHRAGR